MTTVKLNKELNGVEIYFDSKPDFKVLSELKQNGFRWNGKKSCWYNRQSEKSIAFANKFTETETNNSITTSKEHNSENKLLSLWDRVQFTEGSADTSKYDYKFVGSNYTGLTVKETASIIRKHLKSRFPEVKFSVTSDYHSINIYIKASPYSNIQPDSNLYGEAYRKEYALLNPEITAIQDYCQKLLDSYNYDDSDSMTDYFNVHFYDNVGLYDYVQTEQTEEIKTDIIDFRARVTAEQTKQEEEQEKQWQLEQEQREQEAKQAEERQREYNRQTEIINNNHKIIELTEDKQYFIHNVKWAKLNKNNTLEEYQELVQQGDFNFEDIKITHELHFNNEEAFTYFSNMFLHDFDFLNDLGGSRTDDPRINNINDYYNMDTETRKTVKWYRLGLAVYYNNSLQYVIDPQGYSYCRYVGLIEKEEPKLKNSKKIIDITARLQQKKEQEELTKFEERFINDYLPYMTKDDILTLYNTKEQDYSIVLARICMRIDLERAKAERQ